MYVKIAALIHTSALRRAALVHRTPAKSMRGYSAALVLIIGSLAACGTQPADTSAPTSQPAQVVLPATEAPTESQQVTEPAEATRPAAQGAAVSFTNDVLPIIQSRCVNCHGGDRVEKGLVLKSYADLMTGSENGSIVTPGNAADSKLVELIANQKMPKRGPKLTPPQVQLITDWVNQGAVNN